MKDTTVRLVLDTSAVLAYAVGSINVGETIAEVVDEGGHFGVSVLCLVEAARRVGHEHAPGVHLLVQHPRCVVLPVLAEDWRSIAGLTNVFGRADLAVSLLEAVDRNGYVLTAEGSRYGDGTTPLPIVPI